eukprot:19188-Heterococcus_DN1.PRE.1
MSVVALVHRATASYLASATPYVQHQLSCLQQSITTAANTAEISQVALTTTAVIAHIRRLHSVRIDAILAVVDPQQNWRAPATPAVSNALDQRRPVKFEAFCCAAKVLGFVHHLVHCCCVPHDLLGHAAYIDARATEVFGLNHCDLHAAAAQ